MNLQDALNLSLNDALKVARRLSRATSEERSEVNKARRAHGAALVFISVLKGLGALDTDDASRA